MAVEVIMEKNPEKLRIDAATTSFSTCADRFVKGGYRESISFEEQVHELSRVKGITGLAVDFPSQFDDPVKLKQLLANNGLALGMVEIDVFSDPKWKYGSLSSTDNTVRKEAVTLVKRGIDAAESAGAADVQLWLGQDGFDYPFQSDYEAAWNHLTEGITELSEYNRDVKIVIEYKPKEPRNKCHISTIGKALLLCEAAGKPHVGITLDVGHSLMAQENPAESAVLAARQGRLFHLHLNDNYRDWDHDMIIGSVNLWEMIELFWWLRRIGFDGWYGIDIYPYREDGYAALSRTVGMIHKLYEIAGTLDETGIKEKMSQQDIVGTLELLTAHVLR
jgi:xylose isomerase